MRDRISRALASAFLAGEWSGAALLARGEEALGSQAPWITELVARVIAHFPRAPLDARDLLAGFVRLQELIPIPLPHVHRWFVPAPERGRAPWPVVPLRTLADVGEWLGLDEGVLDWLADRKGLESSARVAAFLRYRYRWVPKRSGGFRLLESPRPRLKHVQRRILDEILARIPTHDAAHGFVTGRSALTHAALHVGKRSVLRCDLRAFFADVPTPRAYAVFRAAGYPEEVARTLIGLCTNRVSERILAAAPRPTNVAEIEPRFQLGRRLAGPHLPQGAPSSPALANLCAFGLDCRLTDLGVTYSRYADDLTFSADAPLGPSFVRRVAAIARAEGFALNPAKTRAMSAARRQTVTGIVVNQRPNLARADYDALEATLTNCVRHGPASQTRGIDRFADHLRGRIAWVRQLNPARGDRLAALFDAVDWA